MPETRDGSDKSLLAPLEKSLAELITRGLQRDQHPVAQLFGALAKLEFNDLRLDRAAIGRILRASGIGVEGRVGEILSSFSELSKKGDVISFKGKGDRITIPGEGGEIKGRIIMATAGGFRVLQEGGQLIIDEIAGIKVGRGGSGITAGVKHLVFRPAPGGATEIELSLSGLAARLGKQTFHLPALSGTSEPARRAAPAPKPEPARAPEPEPEPLPPAPPTEPPDMPTEPEPPAPKTSGTSPKPREKIAPKRPEYPNKQELERVAADEQAWKEKIRKEKGGVAGAAFYVLKGEETNKAFLAAAKRLSKEDQTLLTELILNAALAPNQAAAERAVKKTGLAKKAGGSPKFLGLHFSEVSQPLAAILNSGEFGTAAWEYGKVNATDWAASTAPDVKAAAARPSSEFRARVRDAIKSVGRVFTYGSAIEKRLHKLGPAAPMAPEASASEPKDSEEARRIEARLKQGDVASIITNCSADAPVTSPKSFVYVVDAMNRLDYFYNHADPATQNRRDNLVRFLGLPLKGEKLKARGYFLDTVRGRLGIVFNAGNWIDATGRPGEPPARNLGWRDFERGTLKKRSETIKKINALLAEAQIDEALNLSAPDIAEGPGSYAAIVQAMDRLGYFGNKTDVPNDSRRTRNRALIEYINSPSDDPNSIDAHKKTALTAAIARVKDLVLADGQWAPSTAQWMTPATEPEGKVTRPEQTTGTTLSARLRENSQRRAEALKADVLQIENALADYEPNAPDDSPLSYAALVNTLYSEGFFQPGTSEYEALLYFAAHPPAETARAQRHKELLAAIERLEHVAVFEDKWMPVEDKTAEEPKVIVSPGAALPDEPKTEPLHITPHPQSIKAMFADLWGTGQIENALRSYVARRPRELENHAVDEMEKQGYLAAGSDHYRALVNFLNDTDPATLELRQRLLSSIAEKRGLMLQGDEFVPFAPPTPTRTTTNVAFPPPLRFQTSPQASPTLGAVRGPGVPRDRGAGALARTTPPDGLRLPNTMEEYAELFAKRDLIKAMIDNGGFEALLRDQAETAKIREVIFKPGEPAFFGASQIENIIQYVLKAKKPNLALQFAEVYPAGDTNTRNSNYQHLARALFSQDYASTDDERVDFEDTVRRLFSDTARHADIVNALVAVRPEVKNTERISERYEQWGEPLWVFTGAYGRTEDFDEFVRLTHNPAFTKQTVQSDSELQAFLTKKLVELAEPTWAHGRSKTIEELIAALPDEAEFAPPRVQESLRPARVQEAATAAPVFVPPQPQRTLPPGFAYDDDTMGRVVVPSGPAPRAKTDTMAEAERVAMERMEKVDLAFNIIHEEESAIKAIGATEVFESLNDEEWARLGKAVFSADVDAEKIAGPKLRPLIQEAVKNNKLVLAARFAELPPAVPTQLRHNLWFYVAQKLFKFGLLKAPDRNNDPTKTIEKQLVPILAKLPQAEWKESLKTAALLHSVMFGADEHIQPTESESMLDSDWDELLDWFFDEKDPVARKKINTVALHMGATREHIQKMGADWNYVGQQLRKRNPGKSEEELKKILREFLRLLPTAKRLASINRAELGDRPLRGEKTQPGVRPPEPAEAAAPVAEPAPLPASATPDTAKDPHAEHIKTYRDLLARAAPQDIIEDFDKPDFDAAALATALFEGSADYAAGTEQLTAMIALALEKNNARAAFELAKMCPETARRDELIIDLIVQLKLKGLIT